MPSFTGSEWARVPLQMISEEVTFYIECQEKIARLHWWPDEINPPQLNGQRTPSMLRFPRILI